MRPACRSAENWLGLSNMACRIQQIAANLEEEMQVQSAADWLGLSNQQRDMQVGVPRTGWDSRTWQAGSNK